jgi:predicted nucleic acid-binding protein
MARIYLDGCIVIYLIQGSDELNRAITQALRPTEAEPPVAFVSDLTRLECRVWPIGKSDDVLLRQYDEFFASEDLSTIPVTTETFDLATELRGHHGTKTPDALHLAAAILGGCQEFWTNDHRLSSAAEKRIEFKVFSKETAGQR